ncbi:MAG TPA: hypothetical protein V6D17_23490 [Candidatus Obscuribacterales bacterium]
MESDERPYRRGLLLGLTMAEVVMLLLFALLLIWRAGVEDNTKLRDQISALKRDLAERQDSLEEARSKVALLTGRAGPNLFDDLFRELRLAQVEAAILRPSDSLIKELGKEFGLPGETPEKIAEQIRKRLLASKSFVDAPKASGVSVDSGEPAKAASGSETSDKSSDPQVLVDVQKSLYATGLEPKQAAVLEQAARLLRKLGEQAGASAVSVPRMAEQIAERLQIANRVIETAKRSPIADAAETNTGISETLASLIQVQKILAKEDITPEDAAQMARSHQLLRRLGSAMDLTDASPERVAQHIEEQLNIFSGLKQLKEQLERAGLDVGQTAVAIEQMQNQLHEKGLRVRELEGRLKYAENQLQAAGRGTEKPACWANPQTGKPEYIFDVALKSNSLLVRDNALRHRQEEQAKLPVQGIKFEQDVTLQEFRRMTRPIYLWSEKEGCRFFVKVFDVTQTHEKDRYKRDLRTVGEHFYYFEEFNRPFTP